MYMRFPWWVSQCGLGMGREPVIKKILALAACVGGMWVSAITTEAATVTPQQDVQQAEQYVDQALDAAKQGQLVKSHANYEKFHDKWFDIEDGVKQQSGDAYKAIEADMGQVDYAFIQKKDAAVLTALQALKDANLKFVQGGFGHQQFEQQNMSLDDFILLLQQTKSDAKAGNRKQAINDIETVRQSWLSVEGQVVGHSQTVYDATERDMVTVDAMLKASPPDVQGATKLLDNMVASLSPLATQSGYTIWDAAMIPIREGLEALLVVAALLTFVQKSESKKGRNWVWFGVSGGILVSIILAAIVKWVFSSGAFGQNNFLIAGWTGIFAAVMLVYMSYWLHSKSNISDWQKYLRTKTQMALSTGKLLTLGALSFLAVFREGTETVLFIIGMVNQISVQNLLIGLLLGVGILAALAYIMLGIGKRLPMKPFFLVSSLIVFYLSLKFTGLGIHSLQLAGALPSTTLTLPSISFLAFYPSLQSAVPQILLILLALVIIVWQRWHIRKAALNS